MTHNSDLTTSSASSPAGPAALRRLRLASAVAVFPLALAAAPHAAAGPALPGTAADHTFTHTCNRTVAGQTLKVNIAVQFTKANSNDITGVTVRATDNGEAAATTTAR